MAPRESAFGAAHVRGPQPADGGIVTNHGAARRQLDLAIEAIAAEVHEPAAFAENPPLDAVVHPPRPVLGMRAQDEHAIGGQVEHAGVELGLAVQVVGEPFALQPAEQTPLRRRDVTGGPALDGVGDGLAGVDVVDRLRSLERQRSIRGRAPGLVVRVGVAFDLLPRIDRWDRRQCVGVNVVAAPAEIVVGVPVHVRGEHGDCRLRFAGSDNPGKGEAGSRRRPRMEVVEP